MSDNRNPYDVARELGFFAYHGDGNGDHFRKQGLSGWKLVLSMFSYKIQQKDECGFWLTVFSIYSDVSYEFEPVDIELFNQRVRKLAAGEEINEAIF